MADFPDEEEGGEEEGKPRDVWNPAGTGSINNVAGKQKRSILYYRNLAVRQMAGAWGGGVGWGAQERPVL